MLSVAPSKRLEDSPSLLPLQQCADASVRFAAPELHGVVAGGQTVWHIFSGPKDRCAANLCGCAREGAGSKSSLASSSASSVAS